MCHRSRTQLGCSPRLQPLCQVHIPQHSLWPPRENLCNLSSSFQEWYRKVCTEKKSLLESSQSGSCVWKLLELILTELVSINTWVSGCCSLPVVCLSLLKSQCVSLIPYWVQSYSCSCFSWLLQPYPDLSLLKLPSGIQDRPHFIKWLFRSWAIGSVWAQWCPNWQAYDNTIDSTWIHFLKIASRVAQISAVEHGGHHILESHAQHKDTNQIDDWTQVRQTQLGSNRERVLNVYRVNIYVSVSMNLIMTFSSVHSSDWWFLSWPKQASSLVWIWQAEANHGRRMPDHSYSLYVVVKLISVRKKNPVGLKFVEIVSPRLRNSSLLSFNCLSQITISFRIFAYPFPKLSSLSVIQV